MPALDPWLDPRKRRSTWMGQDTALPDGGDTTAPVTTPGGPDGTTPATPDTRTAAQSTWSHFLNLIGGSKHHNPEAAGGWGEVGGRFYRKNLGGFNVYGLAPQESYIENMVGSRPGAPPPAEANKMTPERMWRNLQTAGNWGVHEDPTAPGSAQDWLKQELDVLQGVWGQLGAQEQSLFRDRMLHGTGLPAYLQAFQAARPQWITDYISQTFGSGGAA